MPNKPLIQVGREPETRSANAGDLNPTETAARLLDWCKAKSVLRRDQAIILGLMAGGFIALGAIFFTAIMIGYPTTLGIPRLLASVGFSLGLLLVAMTGAELSTGNCLLVTAWAHGELPGRSIVRNLSIAFVSNVAAAVLLAWLMLGAGLLDGPHGTVAARVAEAKVALTFQQSFVRGIFCNALVCLAVWLILAARTVGGKFIGLAMPIAAFVAVGFEHSVANAYMLLAGLLAGGAVSGSAALTNMVAVTLGNLVGGAAVAIGFWLAFLRRDGQPLPSLGVKEFAKSAGPMMRQSPRHWL